MFLGKKLFLTIHRPFHLVFTENIHVRNLFEPIFLGAHTIPKHLYGALLNVCMRILTCGNSSAILHILYVQASLSVCLSVSLYVGR